MESPGSADRDGSVLDYSRLHKMTIQAWSPFQTPNWGGGFLGDERYPELNRELDALAAQYGISTAAVAAAWILRHPAQMQLITGTARESRLQEIARASEIQLTREEWYRLYLSAGHILP